MHISGMWAYIVLESLVLVSVFAVYLLYTNRMLRRQVTADTDSQWTGAGMKDYARVLQAEIGQAEAAKAGLVADTGIDPRLQTAIDTRLTQLRRELDACEQSAADRQTFWSLIADQLDAGDDPAAAGQVALIAALEERVRAHEKRIGNLEQFKTKFFELKVLYSEARDLGEQLHSKVDQELPADNQSPELKDMLSRLQQENSRLEGQLAQVEQEFESIMRNVQTAAGAADEEGREAGLTGSMDNIEQGVGRIKQVVESQKDQINELNQYISSLQLELKEQERLQQKLGELQEQHDELSNVVAIIQEENDFLQQQISVLLKQELEDRERSATDLAALQRKLEEQLQAQATLENSYAAMEARYLALYEESQTPKS